MTIDLAKYCDNPESRPQLGKPFSFGAFTYASNGRVAVRVPRRDDVAEISDAVKEKAEKLFADAPQGDYFPAPKIELPPDLEEAGECPACDGRGHRHDCPTCHCPCRDCAGTGMEQPARRVSFGLGPAVFGAEFMLNIKDLPKLEFVMPDGTNPTRFRFDGGEGLIMPRRGKQSVHVDLTANAPVNSLKHQEKTWL